MNLEAIEKFDKVAIEHAQKADRVIMPINGSVFEWQRREAESHAQVSLAYSAIVANLTAFRFGQGAP